MPGPSRRLLTPVVALLLAASIVLAEENVLTNSGFEDLTEAGVPADWQVDEGLQLLTGDDAYAGSTAVRARYHGGLRQSMETQPGEMFLLTGYTRRPGAVRA